MMSSGTVALLLFLTLAPAVSALRTEQQASQRAGVNPIRRVVSMMENMQKKIEAEAETEEGLFKKFMCYCENGASALQKSIADADTKVPQLASDIEAAGAKKKQLEQELKAHQADRDSAKEAIATSTAIREKEASTFEKVSSDLKANIAALTKALAAIEKGAAGAFLQTNSAQVLQHVVVDTDYLNGLSEFDKNQVTAFLSNSEDYSPQSGGIVGILKQIGDTMEASLSSATSTENSAIGSFDEMMAAKKSEIEAHTAAIETKTQRIGELGVSVVQMQGDLEDSDEQLIEDKKFLANMDEMCEKKKKEWEEISKMRAEEMTAIAETIKILNDDDALDLFKKALPSSSLLQVVASDKQIRKKALSVIQQMQHKSHMTNKATIDLIALALAGKKVSFDKVLKMIDDLVAALKEEQQDDDHKKEYCEKQFDTTEDKKKELEHKIADLETSIEGATSGIETATADLKALEEGIKALDEEVAEATADRKEEHSDYKDLMASDAAAQELLGMAKNRLNKFYNPKLYKPPPAEASFIQIRAHRSNGEAAPPPPPESFKAYSKKGEESTGIIAMLDTMVADLEKEMTEAKAAEENAQEDYDKFMDDAAEKRALDTKAIVDRTNTKTALESDLVKAKDGKAATVKELMATEEYISSLHGECDFLIKNYDLRKAAREGETDSLTKAKAVLSGADFSLVQQSRRVSLRK